MKLSIENKKPIGNGIITCLNMKQAIARKKKGREAAQAVISVLSTKIMRTPYNPNQSPRVIIIQKLYGNFFNDDTDLTFPKHRFKKFIKDVVLGTIERDEVIKEEVKKYLSEDILQLTNLDKVFQVIVKSAIFEFLYKPKVSTKIIIKEYLDASNFFLEDGQTKYLNAILDKIAKKIRTTNA